MLDPMEGMTEEQRATAIKNGHIMLARAKRASEFLIRYLDSVNDNITSFEASSLAGQKLVEELGREGLNEIILGLGTLNKYGNMLNMILLLERGKQGV